MQTDVVVRWVRPGAVRWSEDNQLFVLSPEVVRILTPTFEDKGGDGPNLTFLKTSVVNLDEKDTVPWTIAKDVRVIRRSVTLKIPEYIAAAWSPTHCSATGGCILACVDSRGSVTLHVPEASPTKQKWKKYLTLDMHVAELWGVLNGDLQPEDLDKVETVSVAWSPKMGAKGSLLTLGSQAGYVTFWNISDASDVRHVTTLQVAKEDVWITQLSWSPLFIENAKRFSYLACGLSNGRVVIFRATSDSNTGATVLDELTFSDDIFKSRRFDISLCTGFAWSYQEPQKSTNGFRLCIAKGGRIYVWNSETDVMVSWKGRSLLSITHIQWSNSNTHITVMFYDGMAHILKVHNDTLEESPPNSNESIFLAQSIIGRCQQQAGGAKEDDDDKGGKDGDAGEDGEDDDGEATGSGQLRILSGDSSPDGYCTAFVYFFQNVGQIRHKQSAVLLLTPSRSDSPTSTDLPVLNQILLNLKALLSIPSLALAQNPSHYLWNTLFYLTNLDHKQLENLNVVDRLLSILDETSQMEVDNSQGQTKVGYPTESSVEDKLMYAMYNDTAITSERALFYLWTNLKALSLPNSFKARLEERATKSTARIRAYVTDLILDQFSQQISAGRLIKETPAGDQTVLLLLCDCVVRMVLSKSEAVQNLKALAKHASQTYRMLKDAFPVHSDLDRPLQVLEDFVHGRETCREAGDTFESKRETCLVCDAPVPFEDETSAMCEYGHPFGRCSTTLQIMSWSLLVCNGCGLKVVAPSSDSDEKASWVDNVLNASPLCVFCLGLRQPVLI